MNESFNKLYENPNTVLYFHDDTRNEFKTPFIVKTTNSISHSENQIVRFKNEFLNSKLLDFDGVRKAYKTGTYNNKPAIWLEFIDAVLIKDFFSEENNDLEQFLTIAIDIADTLGKIHEKRIIHKDLTSANILVNPKDLRITIIDFDTSSRIDLNRFHLGNPDRLEGTLTHISPEQTGRMGRTVDYRSDLYSLGVTFYELLTKKLPFETQDAMEMIHSHIAKSPVPVHKVNPRIPLGISEIINMMMAKDADNRYQSAFGLKHDLEKALKLYRESEDVGLFLLGRKDYFWKFHIPEKLYGREKELKQLIDSFERINHGSSELVFVKGNSGVGKSAIVNALHKPITVKRGWFITGKFEKLNQNKPYQAFIQAFEEFVKYLLVENDENLNRWKEILKEAVGDVGKVLVDLIPSLEHILGPQPDIPQLNGSEAKHRFNYVFQNFIQAVAKRNNPLVLFIDDIHWADSASLSLIEKILQDKGNKYFLLVSAYRSSDVFENRNFVAFLNRIKLIANNHEVIELENLEQKGVTRLIMDTLKTNKRDTSLLAELIYRKTDGNPFFVRQFLKSLYEDQFLNYNYQKQRWEWEIQTIHEHNITDNVIELMISKIEKLPKNVQDILKFAACIGNIFSIETLANISGKSITNITGLLQKAIEDGLIDPIGKDSKFIETSLTEINPRVHCKFIHDRVREAAYSLINDSDKKVVHLRIGRYLFETLSRDKIDENIFEIANQYDFGIDQIRDEHELRNIAELNLLAGKKANEAAAFKQAYRYLNKSINLFGSNLWQEDYAKFLDLYNTAIEATYLCGKFSEMNAIADLVFKHAKNVEDRSAVTMVLMQAAIAQKNPKTALNLGLALSKELGIKLTRSPSKISALWNILQVFIALRGRPIEQLAYLKKMDDPKQITTVRLLVLISLSSFSSDPKLFPIALSRILRYSIKYGNTEVTAFGYSAFGSLLAGLFSRINMGYRFGWVAKKISSTVQASKYKPKVMFQFGDFIAHWKNHYRLCINYFKEAYTVGLEIGDIEYSSYAAFGHIKLLFFSGGNLEEIDKQSEHYLATLGTFKQANTQNWFNIVKQANVNLREKTDQPSNLNGAYFSFDQIKDEEIREDNRLDRFNAFLFQVVLSYLFYDYECAYNLAKETNIDSWSGIGTFNVPIFQFYFGLSILANFDSAHINYNDDQKTFKKILTKFNKWAKHAPDNYAHKYYLLLAEYKRTQGNSQEAIELYDKAIKLAHESEFISEKALALELAAKHLKSQGQLRKAGYYLKDAYSCYHKWGAETKLKHLSKHFMELLDNKDTLPNRPEFPSIYNGSIDSDSRMLDLNTVIKASQSLSGEVVLSKLLKTMMSIIIENAGAELGFLILKNGKYWAIEAEAKIDDENISVLKSVPLKENIVPVSIINYVLRLKKNLVINNASSDKTFGNDEYILYKKPKSILCMPLINHGKLSGVLYLENNHSANIFFEERIELLRLLSSQISISIENALLYKNLEDKVKERTREVVKQKEEIENHKKELENKNSKLTELNNEKNNLIHVVAHDLKSPINQIDGLIRIIKITDEGNLNEEQLSVIEKISGSVSRLRRMITQILDVDAIESHNINLNLEEIDLSRLFIEIIDNYTSTAAEKSIKIIPKIEEEILVTLDRVLISQSIENLLSNAIKFSPFDKKIQTRLYKKGGKVILEIQDEGPGISEEDKEKLFGKFQKLSAKPTGGEHSTGLGLSIVKKYIEKMKGEVWCESKINEGANFILSFRLD